MSAITAIVDFRREGMQVDRGMRLMEELRRYPADYEHVWQDGDAFLGCRGQRITPESLNEILPLRDPASGLVIAADAIIDNREELFGRLAVPKTERAGMTDGELILIAYRQWGQDAPKYLVGDFAFVIWDPRDKTLFGARDFTGARTLYYTQAETGAAFCTAIHPLLALSGAKRGLNEGWLAEFLAIPITTEAVDLQATAYNGIGQAPPAHSFTVREGRIEFAKYVSPLPETKLKLRSDGEYEEAFRDVFRTAVVSKLRTFREVGANLSGGLDSGSVVSFAAAALREANKKLHTFSYVPVDDFRDWTPRSRMANEREQMMETARHVGNIHDQYFSFPELNPLSVVDDWLDMMESPYKFYENSYWKKGIYENARRQNVGVLLSGSRGNWTISWGPALDYHAKLLRGARWGRLYREMTLYSANLGVERSRLYPVVAKKAFPSLAGLWKRFRRPDAPEDSDIPRLINPEFAKRTDVYERLKEHGYDFWGDPSQNVYEVRRKQFEKPYYWTVTGTAGCKQSLRYGLWERDATNDLRVIRFCLSVPEDQFVRNGYGRSLIRRATRDYLPDAVRLNQKVRGIQGADGLHRMLPAWNGLLEEWQALVDDVSVAPYLNRPELIRALEAVRREPRPELVFDTDFRLLMRGLIFRRFMHRHA